MVLFVSRDIMDHVPHTSFSTTFFTFLLPGLTSSVVSYLTRLASSLCLVTSLFFYQSMDNPLLNAKSLMTCIILTLTSCLTIPLPLLLHLSPDLLLPPLSLVLAVILPHLTLPQWIFTLPDGLHRR